LLALFARSQYAVFSSIFNPFLVNRAFKEAIEEQNWDVQIPNNPDHEQDQTEPKKAAKKSKVGEGRTFQREGSSGSLPDPCNGLESIHGMVVTSLETVYLNISARQNHTVLSRAIASCRIALALSSLS
jgi:hypothetical protein